MVLPILPKEIELKIKKLACNRCHNGKSAIDFVVICRLNKQITKEIVDEVREWFFSRLENIRHSAIYCSGRWSWNILVRYYPTFPQHAPVDPFTQITFYIHLDQRRERPSPEYILIDETPPREMSTYYFSEYLYGEPEYVVAIGVSGVSEKYMKKKWWAQIGGKNGYGQINTWGYGLALLKNGFASTSQGALQPKWYMSRDKSFSFRWKDYPHCNRSGDQLLIILNRIKELQTDIQSIKNEMGII